MGRERRGVRARGAARAVAEKRSQPHKGEGRGRVAACGGWLVGWGWGGGGGGRWTKRGTAVDGRWGVGRGGWGGGIPVAGRWRSSRLPPPTHNRKLKWMKKLSDVQMKRRVGGPRGRPSGERGRSLVDGSKNGHRGVVVERWWSGQPPVSLDNGKAGGATRQRAAPCTGTVAHLCG